MKLTVSLHCILLTVEHSWWLERYQKYHHRWTRNEPVLHITDITDELRITCTSFLPSRKRISWSTRLFHHCVTSGLHVWTALLQEVNIMTCGIGRDVLHYGMWIVEVCNRNCGKNRVCDMAWVGQYGLHALIWYNLWFEITEVQSW